MWEISNAGQSNTLLSAVILGAFLCLLYDLIRLDRMIFKRGTLAVFFEDVLFWLIASFMTVCLLILKTNGQIRGFVLPAMAVGFFAWRFSVSRIVDKSAPFIKKAVKKTRCFYLKGISYLSKTDEFLKKILKQVYTRHFLNKKELKKAKNNAKNP